MWRSILFNVLIITLFCSCHNIALHESPSGKFLFLGHTYYMDDPDTTVQHIDPRLYSVPYEDFELLLLGGDLCYNTSGDKHTLYGLDSLFHLSGPNTFWALGNHDAVHPEWVQEICGKPLSYAVYRHGVTFIVLNTEGSDDVCSGSRLDLIRTVCDTLSRSRALFLMTHKLIWLYGNEDLSEMSDMANGGICEPSWCVHPNSFHQKIYPFLHQMRKKDVEVICVAGDLGVRSSSFSYFSKDSIAFLASGLSRHAKDGDQVLIFERYSEKPVIRWHYELLNKLVDK